METPRDPLSMPGRSGDAQAEWACLSGDCSLGGCRRGVSATGAGAQPASSPLGLIGFSFILWNLTALVVAFHG